MARDNDAHDHFDSDEFVSDKFEKVKPPHRFVISSKDRKDNFRDKRRSKEKDRNKFFDK